MVVQTRLYGPLRLYMGGDLVYRMVLTRCVACALGRSMIFSRWAPMTMAWDRRLMQGRQIRMDWEPNLELECNDLEVCELKGLGLALERWKAFADTSVKLFCSVKWGTRNLLIQTSIFAIMTSNLILLRQPRTQEDSISLNQSRGAPPSPPHPHPQPHFPIERQPKDFYFSSPPFNLRWALSKAECTFPQFSILYCGSRQLWANIALPLYNSLEI